MFKKRFSNHVPSKLCKAIKDKVSNPRSLGGKGVNSPSEKPTCTKCGKKHISDCLVGIDHFFGRGKSGYKVRDYLMLKAKGSESNQAQASSPFFDASCLGTDYHFSPCSGCGKIHRVRCLGVERVSLFMVKTQKLQKERVRKWTVVSGIRVFKR